MKNKRSETDGPGPQMLLVLALTAACSTGGGGGGDVDEDDFIPSKLDFSFTTGGVANPLTVEFDDAGQEAVHSVGVEMTIAGVYDVDRDLWGNDRTTEFLLDSGALFGALDVTVFLPLEGPAWANPVDGALEIRQKSTGDLVLVSVNTAAGGVDIFYDDLADGNNVLGPFTYDWEELLALFDTSTAEYERIASFSWSTVELLRQRFLMVFEVFADLFDRKDFMEEVGAGDRFAIGGACGTLPGSTDFGDAIYVWTDDDLDGRVDDGDSFTVTLEDCWVDVPGRLDHLYDGEFKLTGFALDESPFETGATVEFTQVHESVTLGDEFGAVILPDFDSVTRGDSGVLFD